MTALHRKRDLCDFRIKVTLSTQKSLTRKNLQYTTKKKSKENQNATHIKSGKNCQIFDDFQCIRYKIRKYRMDKNVGVFCCAASVVNASIFPLLYYRPTYRHICFIKSSLHCCYAIADGFCAAGSPMIFAR